MAASFAPVACICILCIPVGSSAALRVRAMACRPRALRELSPRGAAVDIGWLSGAARTHATERAPSCFVLRCWMLLLSSLSRDSRRQGLRAATTWVRELRESESSAPRGHTCVVSARHVVAWRGEQPNSDSTANGPAQGALSVYAGRRQ